MKKHKKCCQKWVQRIEARIVKDYGQQTLEDLKEFANNDDNKIPRARRNVGILRWIRWFGGLTICALLTWYKGAEGVLLGGLFSVAFIVMANTTWLMYCEAAVYPGGIHSYNSCQKLLKKYKFDGPVFHKVIRTYWFQKAIDFVYTADRNHYSWRIYSLVAAFVALAFSKPLIGAACFAIALSLFTALAGSTNMPIALYLGDSSEASHDFFVRIRTISGIEWSSLLRDISEMPESLIESGAFTNMKKAMKYKNRWSLRMDSAGNWRKVVRDFIQASAIIVLKPEPFGPVREEIEALSKTDFLQRIMIIDTGDQELEYLPERLRGCVLSEEEAEHLIAMTASRPRIFKEHMKARLKKGVSEKGQVCS